MFVDSLFRRFAAVNYYFFKVFYCQLFEVFIRKGRSGGEGGGKGDQDGEYL